MFTPAKRARFTRDQRLEPGPSLPQMMEFASEVRLRLSVGGLRPERAADTLTRNRTAARMEHEKRDQLLLTRARHTRHRATVNTNREAAKQIDAKLGGARHRSRLHVNRCSPEFWLS